VLGEIYLVYKKINKIHVFFGYYYRTSDVVMSRNYFLIITYAFKYKAGRYRNRKRWNPRKKIIIIKKKKAISLLQMLV
jgi:hypothetical protein